MDSVRCAFDARRAGRLAKAVRCATALWVCLVAASHPGAAQTADVTSELAANPATRREAAELELREANEAVRQAREALGTARSKLEKFVATHFAQQQEEAAEPAPPEHRAAPELKPEGEEYQRLNEQLRSLQAQRDQLLDRLTPAHPEVVDLDQRIQGVSQRIEALEQAAKGSASDSPDNFEGSNRSQYIASLKSRQLEASERYRQLRADVRTAERDLRQAIARETEATERLARLPAETPSKTSTPTPVAAAPVPVEPSGPTGDNASREAMSQQLALAAFLLALVVAAWASVKLARSSSDVMFSSVDDVATTLALPVVGVIPAAAPARAVAVPAAASPLRSTLVLLGQIVLAIVVFAAVAYCVQNVAPFWRR